MSSKVLIVTTVRWPSAARVAAAFAATGCRVVGLLPARHPAEHSRYFEQTYLYHPLAGRGSFLAAIRRSNPDFIVPLDDRAVSLLLSVQARAGGRVAELIETSLGRSQSYAAALSRNGFIEIARSCGVRTPLTRSITGSELEGVLAEWDLPVVLKADGTWGGVGVIVARSRASAIDAYDVLARARPLLRSAVAAQRESDLHLFRDAVTRVRRPVILQQFVSGTPATTSFASWRGELLAANHFETVEARDANGPASVLQRIDSDEMQETAVRIAAHLGLTGLHGIDYVRDATGKAYVIEMNPRSPQTGSLSFGAGHDLVSALAERIDGAPHAPRPQPASDLIALFPQEWMRDPASPYLTTAFHDVPWDDPSVLTAVIGSRELKAVIGNRGALAGPIRAVADVSISNPRQPALRDLVARSGTAGVRGTIAQSTLGMIDQGIVALGSLLPVVLLGHLAGAEQLGLYSLAVAVALFLTIVGQNLLLSGYPIFRARDETASDANLFHAVSQSAAGLLLLLPLVLAAVAYSPHVQPDVALPGAVLVGFILSSSARQLLRTLSLSRQELLPALALDLVVFTATAVGLTWLARRGAMELASTCTALLVANIAYVFAWLGVYRRRIIPQRAGALRYLAQAIDFGKWAFLSAIFGSTPYYAAPWLLALLQGTKAAAVYASASTVVGVVNHSLLGLTKGNDGRTADAYHRGGIGALDATVNDLLKVIVPGLTVIVAIVFFAANSLGRLVLPSHAAEVASVARLLSLSLLVGSVRVIYGSGLWAMGLPRATVPAGLVRGTVCVVAGAYGVYAAGPIGMAAAVLAGDLVSTAIVARKYRVITAGRARAPDIGNADSPIGASLAGAPSTHRRPEF
ncbi:MAG TPA: ATP-grasp domain-containing protein [Bauldia sp.]|nr:ATP-grasp domain-containing protein [Bauldia sp.]